MCASLERPRRETSRCSPLPRKFLSLPECGTGALTGHFYFHRPRVSHSAHGSLSRDSCSSSFSSPTSKPLGSFSAASKVFPAYPRPCRSVWVCVGPCLSVWVHVRGSRPSHPSFSSPTSKPLGSWFTVLQTAGPLTPASNRAQTTPKESNVSSPGQVALSRVTQPRDLSPTKFLRTLGSTNGSGFVQPRSGVGSLMWCADPWAAPSATQTGPRSGILTRCYTTPICGVRGPNDRRGCRSHTGGARNHLFRMSHQYYSLLKFVHAAKILGRREP
jgi:hypothetical protein